MPEIERYTPSQLATESQQLAENFRSALHQFADISDAIDYCNEGTSEYHSKVQDLEDEIAEDNGYFEDISEAIQSKTGQTEPYDKSELAGAIDGIVVDPNANLDAYIQGDLNDIVFNGTTVRAYAFRGVEITSISMPNVTVIEAGAFYQSSLPTIVLPQGLKAIRSNGFTLMSKLQIVDVSEVETIPSISANAFNSTTCIFLFRDQIQLDEYAAATNWSTLADRFQIKGGGS